MTIPSAPSLHQYGTLNGQLFLYAQGRAAFESPFLALSHVRPSSSNSPTAADAEGRAVQQMFAPNKCILLGGLSDGLLPVPYTSKLENACRQSNWSLVQPILSSSYLGYGHGSLQRDTEELDELVSHLLYRNQQQQQQQPPPGSNNNKDDDPESASFALVGHSTGCQNAMHYLQHGTHASRFQLMVLQAPVSDREHAMMNRGEYNKYFDIARQMRQNNQIDEMMPRNAFWAPITASRYLDLHERGGADDYFSSDYTDDELIERLRHVGRQGTPKDGSDGSSSGTSLKVLVAFSGSDEYVPDHVDSQHLTDRLVNAMNHNTPSVAEGLYLSSANHNLSESDGDDDRFVSKVQEMLLKCSHKISSRNSAIL